MEQKELEWPWNKVSTPLSKLDQRQLCSIQDTLSKTETDRKWFGKSNKEWNDAINPLLKKASIQNINDISRVRNNKRIASAQGIADRILTMYK